MSLHYLLNLLGTFLVDIDGSFIVVMVFWPAGKLFVEHWIACLLLKSASNFLHWNEAPTNVMPNNASF